MRFPLLIGAAVAAIATASCGTYSNSSNTPYGGGGGGGGGTNAIQFGGTLGFAYSPASLTVKVGDTVTWQGDFAVHPLVSGATCGMPDGNFSNSTGTSFSHTFTTAGTYPYNCSVHCSVGMKGTVTVQ